MRIVEIIALENGAHRNQDGGLSIVPEGWAVVPEGLECENFPFGEVTVEEIDGVMTVTSWVAGEMPADSEPMPEPETEVTTDDMAAAILEGVNDV